jgi:hypothetical protein
MLGEIAITPGVFREECYSNAVAAAVAWERLRDPILQECLVRDLQEGGWSRYLLTQQGAMAPKAKELLKKLAKRLRRVPKCGEGDPAQDLDWCREALASALQWPLDCIVTTRETAGGHSGEALVADVERVNVHDWWTRRGPSLRLNRTTEAYCEALGRLLPASNSVLFIDPHLDPKRPSYTEFFRLLHLCNRPVAPVRVELHRVCFQGSGPDRKLVTPTLEQHFHDTLKPNLAGLNVKVEVFIWDDFHDRFLISNLLGMSLANGFDTDNKVNNKTTWTRLKASDCDDVLREFDPASSPHTLHHRFTLLQ